MALDLLDPSPDWATIPAVAAHGRHLPYLLEAGPDGLFAGVEMAQAEEGAAAAALTVRAVPAVRDAASPGLVLGVDQRPVLEVGSEVITLGNAVLAAADFLTVIA